MLRESYMPTRHDLPNNRMGLSRRPSSHRRPFLLNNCDYPKKRSRRSRDQAAGCAFALASARNKQDT